LFPPKSNFHSNVSYAQSWSVSQDSIYYHFQALNLKTYSTPIYIWWFIMYMMCLWCVLWCYLMLMILFMMLIDVFMMLYDVFMMLYDDLWCLFDVFMMLCDAYDVFYDVLWCYLMCFMIRFWFLWCYLMSIWCLWCVLWSYMMWYDLFNTFVNASKSSGWTYSFIDLLT